MPVVGRARHSVWRGLGLTLLITVITATPLIPPGLVLAADPSPTTPPPGKTGDDPTPPANGGRVVQRPPVTLGSPTDAGDGAAGGLTDPAGDHSVGLRPDLPRTVLPDRPTPDKSLWTEGSRTTANPDGTLILEASGGRMNYQDVTGEYQPIDLSLVADPTDGYDLRVAANDREVRFATSDAESAIASLSTDEGSIGIRAIDFPSTLVGAAPEPAAPGEVPVESLAPPVDPAPSESPVPPVDPAPSAPPRFRSRPWSQACRRFLTRLAPLLRPRRRHQRRSSRPSRRRLPRARSHRLPSPALTPLIRASNSSRTRRVASSTPVRPIVGSSSGPSLTIQPNQTRMRLPSSLMASARASTRTNGPFCCIAWVQRSAAFRVTRLRASSVHRSCSMRTRSRLRPKPSPSHSTTPRRSIRPSTSPRAHGPLWRLASW